LNRDPLEDAEINAGLNLYAFVYNSPTAHIDPFGHDILDDPDSKNHLDKYGDCTKEQHSKLHNAASIACKSSGKMRCEKGGVKLFL
jgi:hypothetical protein